MAILVLVVKMAPLGLLVLPDLRVPTGSLESKGTPESQGRRETPVLLGHKVWQDPQALTVLMVFLDSRVAEELRGHLVLLGFLVLRAELDLQALLELQDLRGP